ncbi:TadE family protein [Actinoplanes sp. N902-109]|nr:TadE family protein [Actinoplanes sp. N902-109]
MAVVLPLLLLVVLGIIEFGLGWNRQLNLTEAAHQGARVAALTGDPARVTETVDAILGVSAQNTQLDTSISTCADDTTGSATVDLTLSYDSPTGLGSLMARFGRRNITMFQLHATGVMPCVG